jgi:hypothetical protein
MASHLNREVIMEIDLSLDALKQHVFYELMNMAGRVYIIVRYSERVRIGNRGFTEEEKIKGIVLVFNHAMNFRWEDGAISAKLSFGTTVEGCYIPSDDIVAVFSPDIDVRFIVGDKSPKEPPQSAGTTKSKPTKSSSTKPKGGKVIEVDFTKKRH